MPNQMFMPNHSDGCCIWIHSSVRIGKNDVNDTGRC